jgi:hypothetical protein
VVPGRRVAPGAVYQDVPRSDWSASRLLVVQRLKSHYPQGTLTFMCIRLRTANVHGLCIRTCRRYPMLLFAVAVIIFSAETAPAQMRLEPFAYKPSGTAPPTQRFHATARIPARAVDDLKNYPSFNEFRRYLGDAIRRRDSTAIRRVLSHDFVAVYCCEEAPQGSEAVTQWWQSVEALPSGYYGNFLRILGAALEFGVRKDSRTGTFCGPAFETDALIGDNAESTIVIAHNAPLRKEPSASSPVIGLVS